MIHFSVFLCTASIGLKNLSIYNDFIVLILCEYWFKKISVNGDIVEALTDEIEEESQAVSEVFRIKEILHNSQDEVSVCLFHCFDYNPECLFSLLFY